MPLHFPAPLRASACRSTEYCSLPLVSSGRIGGEQPANPVATAEVSIHTQLGACERMLLAAWLFASPRTMNLANVSPNLVAAPQKSRKNTVGQCTKSAVLVTNKLAVSCTPHRAGPFAGQLHLMASRAHSAAREAATVAPLWSHSVGYGGFRVLLPRRRLWRIPTINGGSRLPPRHTLSCALRRTPPSPNRRRLGRPIRVAPTTNSCSSSRPATP